MRSQSSFFDGTYDWQAMLEHDEHLLSEAKEKVLSWRVNMGEGKKKKKGSREKMVNFDKFRSCFSIPSPEILLVLFLAGLQRWKTGLFGKMKELFLG